MGGDLSAYLHSVYLWKQLQNVGVQNKCRNILPHNFANPNALNAYFAGTHDPSKHVMSIELAISKIPNTNGVETNEFCNVNSDVKKIITGIKTNAEGADALIQNYCSWFCHTAWNTLLT